MDQLQSMRLFVRVVELGSISKAAQEFRTGQPAATKHMAYLEQHVGVRLLNRSSKGVVPTEIGQLFYERCKSISQQIEDAVSSVHLLQSKPHGTLRISSSVAFGRRVLAPIVMKFMQEYPQLRIELTFDDLYVNLIEQGFDIAIRMGRLADSSLGASYLGVNPWVLCASPQYLSQHKAPTHPDQISQHPALIYSSVQGDARWHFSSRGHKSVAVPVDGPFRSNNLSALYDAAKNGIGIAALPMYVAQSGLRTKKLEMLLPQWSLPSQEIHAVYPSPKLVPAKVTALITWLQRHLQGDWWEDFPAK